MTAVLWSKMLIEVNCQSFAEGDTLRIYFFLVSSGVEAPKAFWRVNAKRDSLKQGVGSNRELKHTRERPLAVRAVLTSPLSIHAYIVFRLTPTMRRASSIRMKTMSRWHCGHVAH